MSLADHADLESRPQNALARLNGVDAGYQAGPVLRGVDFEVRARQCALVCGPTSAGKTTLMHVLRLAIAPRAGQAMILETDAARLTGGLRARLKRRIGYVAENPNFVEHWSAFENIALPLRMAGQRPRDYAGDVRELVNFVGLETADQPASTLSAAARRLAAIARALAVKPDLILCDDPTSGMSPDLGRRIVRLLMEMRRVGAGVVITTQDESLADIGPCVRWRLERGRLKPADFFVPDEFETER